MVTEPRSSTDSTTAVAVLTRQSDPFPALRAAAERHWYARDENGFRVLLRYEDCALVQRDTRFFEPGIEMLEAQGLKSGPIYEWWTSSLFNEDHHGRLRGLVSAAFTPAAVARLLPMIRSVVGERIAAIADRSRFDLIVEYADVIPVEVIAGMLAIPGEDREQLARWSRTLGQVFAPFTPLVHLQLEGAMSGLNRYVDGLIEMRRTAPGSDLVSMLVVAEQRGDVSDAELRALVATLLFAAHDTTRSAIGCLTATLLDHPAVAGRLVREPEARAAIIEELLRFAPPVAGGLRKAREDVPLRHGMIEADEVVIVSGLSANRDPEAFAAPDCLDPDRFSDGTASIPRPLTFGLGARHCLGASLARAVLAEALPALFAHRPELRASNGTIRWRDHGFRCPSELWLTDENEASCPRGEDD